MNNRNDIVIKNDLMVSDNIQDILNNHIPIEKICEDVYSSISKEELNDNEITIEKYDNKCFFSIYKGSRSIRLILDNNKYNIIISRNNNIIAVLKISNISNKTIEFIKINNTFGAHFNADTFLLNNSYIIRVQYNENNNEEVV